MKTSFLNRERLPLVVEPDGEEPLSELCGPRRDLLTRALLEHGAVLLRGFGAAGAEGLSRFAREFSGREPLDYAGGASPRVRLGGGVYTSTEYPRHYTLSPHNELSYTHRWPAHLYFYCERAADSGGETPLGDSRAILGAVRPEVAARFREKRIRYVRTLGGRPGTGYSWQEVFETEDGRAVEAFCRAGGVGFEWRADGSLRLTEVRPATMRHPATGEEVWFNQAEAFHPSALSPEDYAALTSEGGEDSLRLNATYGDGTPLEPSALEHVREVTRRAAVLVPWREGDLLILDNLLVCHGRMPFEGPRRILLAMT